MVALFTVFSDQETRFDEAGLGIATSDGTRAHALGQIHCRDISDAATCLRDAEARSLPHRVLWLGASQLYGINQRTDADRTAPYLAFDELRNDGWDLVTFAQPNGNLQEHYVLFEYLHRRLPVHGLILAAVYDDMREQGIRETIAYGIEDDAVAKRLAQTAIGRQLLSDLNQVRETASPAAAVRPVENSGTPQERSEAWISSTLEACCAMETLRREARGQLLLALGNARRYLETLRGLHTRDLSRYRVPVPPGRYQANRAALEEILRAARAAEIPTLIYVAPRPTDFFPYDLEAYQAYKKDMSKLAGAYGAILVNFEGIVPNEFWGEVELTFGFPVRDPFHFQGAGHRLLAQAVIDAVRTHFVSGQAK
jgi:hypothetical protein